VGRALPTSPPSARASRRQPKVPGARTVGAFVVNIWSRSRPHLRVLKGTPLAWKAGLSCEKAGQSPVPAILETEEGRGSNPLAPTTEPPCGFRIGPISAGSLRSVNIGQNAMGRVQGWPSQAFTHRRRRVATRLAHP
jgi:hypothetical protein